MKNRLIFIQFLILFVLGIHLHAQNNNEMKRIDIETFNKNSDGSDWWFEEGDTTVIIIRRDWVYFEERHKKGETKTLYYDYDRNGRLLKSYQSLSGVMCGITKEYDAQGNVTKETDEDAPYAFSLDNLRKLILEKFDYDIYKTDKRVTVTRKKSDNEFNSRSTYDVTLETNPYYNTNYRYIKVNAQTGDILYIKDNKFKKIYDGGAYRELSKTDSIAQNAKKDAYQPKSNWIID